MWNIFGETGVLKKFKQWPIVSRILQYAGICSKYPAIQLQTAKTGLLGEMEAAAYLRKEGWRIISKNFRFGHYEIDIVAVNPDESTISLVEVRSTKSATKSPECTID